jgi:hypothetical protein
MKAIAAVKRTKHTDQPKLDEDRSKTKQKAELLGSLLLL